jgi:hypothetical protein
MAVEDEFDLLVRAFIAATGLIGPHYFLLPIAGQEGPSYRERVYCYELYHQLRSILERDRRLPYILNGEVDKSGHPLLLDEIGPRKPDFIVHVPRSMHGNLAVIEVKPITSTLDAFREALLSLRSFLERAQYFGAIALVYGRNDGRGWANIFDEMVGALTPKPILLLHHEEPEEQAKIVRDLRQSRDIVVG